VKNHGLARGYLYAGTSAPERFQPNILDPDEEMVIRGKTIYPAESEVIHRITIVTPNGVTATTSF